MKSMVLGGGCFWCTEAVFQEVDGVVNVIPGYSGGTAANPTYEQVCGGGTGHAEVVRVTYDERVIDISEILKIFFLTHDPTSLNRQGADVGTEYRSAIFYEYENDRKAIEDFIADAQAQLSRPIVTEVAALTTFYEAESYHHNYFRSHPEQAYCFAVINPKMAKLRAYLNSK